MNVLHVISDENIGGAGILLLNLLSCMTDARIKSTVALPSDSLLMARLEELGIPTLPLLHPCDRIAVASVRELVGAIHRCGADIVHANAAVCARVAGRLCGVRVIHTRHCCFQPSGLLKIPLLRGMSGMVNCLLSDCVIATADAAAENLRAIGIPQRKISVIINGSKPIRTVSDGELDAVRRKLSIEASDFCVGICARLEAYKGHDTFLQVVRILCDRAPRIPFRFLIVGTGTRHAELEETARLLGIENAVRFTGFVSDMAPIYRLLRINVNCSSGTETSCLALSEGMSAGVPCVASDYGGNRAMIGDGEAGMLFPVGDANALAECILCIASSPVREAHMRRAALLRYEQKYTAMRMADEVTALYERTVKK